MVSQPRLSPQGFPTPSIKSSSGPMIESTRFQRCAYPWLHSKCVGTLKIEPIVQLAYGLYHSLTCAETRALPCAGVPQHWSALALFGLFMSKIVVEVGFLGISIAPRLLVFNQSQNSSRITKYAGSTMKKIRKLIDPNSFSQTSALTAKHPCANTRSSSSFPYRKQKYFRTSA